MTPQDAAETATGGAGLPLAYVSASPSLRDSKTWPRLYRAVTKGMRNCRPVTFADIFDGAEDYRDRWSQIAPTLVGGVVVPLRRGESLLIGPGTLREARDLRALGKTVLLFGPRGFVFWQSIEVRETAAAPPWIAAEIVLPAPRTQDGQR